MVWAGLRRVPREHEDAARLAGVRPEPVVVPQVLPSLAAAWTALYVLSVTEFAACSLTAPPGGSLLALFVVNEAHYGQGVTLVGLCLLLFADPFF